MGGPEQSPAGGQEQSIPPPLPSSSCCPILLAASIQDAEGEGYPVIQSGRFSLPGHRAESSEGCGMEPAPISIPYTMENPVFLGNSWGIYVGIGNLEETRILP